MTKPWGFKCTRCGENSDGWVSVEAATAYGNSHARVCPADREVARTPDPDDSGHRYFHAWVGSKACRRCGALVGLGLTTLHDEFHATRPETQETP